MTAPSTREASAGLSPAEARARLERVGPNELAAAPRRPWPLRLLAQLREPMALLLVAAAAVSGFVLGERADAVAIVAIVLLNAVLGVVEEGRSERALESLRALEAPAARVVRGGSVVSVPSREVVPGDLVLLAAGDGVPADLGLLEADALEADESLLTGESLPVAKRAAVSRAGAPASMAEVPEEARAFSGTLVTRGSGAGRVLATGMATAVGAIAQHVRAPSPPTPLQVEMRRLTATLGTICIVVAAAVLGLTLLRAGSGGIPLDQAFLAAVALAVAAVPEGLATVVTVALALGVRRMASRGAIVRRLPAVETLGATDLILSDKTGTLTENRMRVEAVALPGRAPVPPEALDTPAAERIAEVAVLCNDATLDPPSGDPLEVALLEMAGQERVAALRQSNPRLAVEPFDADRRRMSALHRTTAGSFLFVKGSPEGVLERCSGETLADGSRVELGPEAREAVLDAAADLAASGMRVLAFAGRSLASAPPDVGAAVQDLDLIGLVALRDPLRPEASRTVSLAASAGVRIVMVTGDHPHTARAIAEAAGVAGRGAAILTGDDLRGAGIPEDLLAAPVYARVSPDQKLALVEAARAGGHVVAVTGDGVNDAPALRRADIGVAMGRSGSDVARQAADMVVTDDNLATIVDAVREGRGIYDNVRSVVDYLVAGNLSEIAVVVTCLLLFPALGVPLLPIQLLWVNLLTDGLPALALGVDPVDDRLMERPPRPRGERLVSWRRLRLLLARAAPIAASAVASLAVARFEWDEPWPHARATMFTVLVVAHLLYAFAARRRGVALLGNRALLLAVGGGIALQLLVVALPAAHGLFGTATLTLREWALVAAGGVLPLPILWMMRR